MKNLISDYYEKTKLHAPNFDPLYSSEMIKNPDVFKRNNGIFSHVYDRAHRNGFIVVPFKKGDDKSLPPNVFTRYTMKSLKRKQNFLQRKEVERMNA